MSCFVAGTFAKVPVTGNKIRLTDNWEFLRQGTGTPYKERPAGGTTYMDKSYVAPLL